MAERGNICEDTPPNEGNGSTLKNPTREYLFSLKKVELQKHCIELGLKNIIWETKVTLVNAIMEMFTPSDNQQLASDSLLQSILSDIEDMKEKMKNKDLEIGELHAKLQQSEESVNQLNKRIAKLEGKLNHQGGDHSDLLSTLQADAEESKKKLLLGDSNLLEILPSDLGADTLIRTLPGANLDLLKSWVTDKLNISLNECVIYCGFQDLVKGDTNLDFVFDSLGVLIAEIKAKNENVKVSVCELAPSLSSPAMQDSVSIFNSKILKWCEGSEDISLIRTAPHFTLGTGEPDESCFIHENDFPIDKLNRIGSMRLLDAIYKVDKSYLCNDWNKVKSKSFNQHLPSRGRYASTRVSMNDGNRNYYAPQMNANIGESEHLQIPGNSRQVSFRRASDYFQSGSFQHQSRNQDDETMKNLPRPQLASHWSTSYSQRGRYGNPGALPYPPARPSPRHSDQRTPLPQSNFRSEGTRRGCFNCGELNHYSDTCRFDHRLRCGYCNQLGHKTRLCRNSYNQ